MKISYWITISDKWNPCLYVDFVTKKQKEVRLLWANAVKFAEKIYINKNMKHIWEIKEKTDSMYKEKHNI